MYVYMSVSPPPPPLYPPKQNQNIPSSPLTTHQKHDACAHACSGLTGPQHMGAAEKALLERLQATKVAVRAALADDFDIPQASEIGEERDKEKRFFYCV